MAAMEPLFCFIVSIKHHAKLALRLGIYAYIHKSRHPGRAFSRDLGGVTCADINPSRTRCHIHFLVRHHLVNYFPFNGVKAVSKRGDQLKSINLFEG